MAVLIMYVDDIIVIGHHTEEMILIKEMLAKEFEVKDLGALSKSGKGLSFKKTTERKVEVFTDANWAGSVDDRKYTSGYCTIISGNVVTWQSKKQTVAARSSVEVEYRAMAHGVCKAIWINGD
ncbi:secreted RxLR effector protein 161-like [Humulus lupulus]|uniref:secreted RxLR effector protein 161-like n=1 Tax=Humulus lupulus TaxID=3486 RepID=UPI002B40A084|nr:secreted RxLR effector protein 161-like [Humulus lupulus]